MKISKLGLILVIIFLFITLSGSVYLQFTYGDSQWMWGFIFGGMPLSQYGISILWFASTLGSIIGGWTLVLGSYVLNAFILYFIGMLLKNLYKKLRP